MANRYADRRPVTLKHIHRIEGDGYGWRVQITRRGRDHWRYFPDEADGPARSLAAAIGWRDQLWRDVGPARHERPTVTDRSSTGIVGVTREVYATTSGAFTERYRAEWVDESDRHCRPSFSIHKYGEEAARRMAVEARRKGVAAAAKARRVRLHDMLHMHKQVLGDDASEV